MPISSGQFFASVNIPRRNSGKNTAALNSSLWKVKKSLSLQKDFAGQ